MTVLPFPMRRRSKKKHVALMIPCDFPLDVLGRLFRRRGYSIYYGQRVALVLVRAPSAKSADENTWLPRGRVLSFGADEGRPGGRARGDATERICAVVVDSIAGRPGIYFEGVTVWVGFQSFLVWIYAHSETEDSSCGGSDSRKIRPEPGSDYIFPKGLRWC